MNMQSNTAGMSRDAAWAVISAVLLLCPAIAFAQTSNRPSTTRSLTKSDAKPVCVYKGVMSDAEIEACTGHRVQYDYRVHETRQRSYPVPTARLSLDQGRK